MLELLFLLLPIAAGYGWYMGRRNSIYTQQQDENRHSRNFVTGINFLLSDQKEQALELFTAIAKEKEDNFEAHLTLGNLLRTRGEIDSALQIHQALLASETLNYEQRLLATQQLGKTYLIAGLLDRAEDCFKSLLDETDFRSYALSQLLNIYQSVSDWQQAIHIAKELIKLGQKEYIKLQAHFYCELAQVARLNDKFQECTDYLKRAIETDSECARASIMLGRLAQNENRFIDALIHFQAILKQDKVRIVEVLDECKTCFESIAQQVEQDNQSEQTTPLSSLYSKLLYTSWQALLLKCLEEDIGSSVHIFYLEYLLNKHNIDAAKNHLKSTLFNKPTLKLLLKFIELQMGKQRDPESQESFGILRDIIKEHSNSKSKYRCTTCGFQAHTLYWHCPSCRKWNTLYQIKGIDGD